MKKTLHKHGSPCAKDCPDRSGTCHGTCAKYKEFERKNAERREAKQKDGKWIYRAYSDSKKRRSQP